MISNPSNPVFLHDFVATRKLCSFDPVHLFHGQASSIGQKLSSGVRGSPGPGRTCSRLGACRCRYVPRHRRRRPGWSSHPQSGHCSLERSLSGYSSLRNRDRWCCSGKSSHPSRSAFVREPPYPWPPFMPPSPFGPPASSLPPPGAGFPECSTCAPCGRAGAPAGSTRPSPRL